MRRVHTGRSADQIHEAEALPRSRGAASQIVPIEFEFNRDKRTARMRIDGQFETESQPIRNPVTGEEHHVLVQMPEGFEYRLAEIGRATVNRSDGAIKFDIPGGHSSLAETTFTNQ